MEYLKLLQTEFINKQENDSETKNWNDMRAIVGKSDPKEVIQLQIPKKFYATEEDLRKDFKEDPKFKIFSVEFIDES